jgi:hypothetical protein
MPIPVRTTPIQNLNQQAEQAHTVNIETLEAQSERAEIIDDEDITPDASMTPR